MTRSARYPLRPLSYAATLIEEATPGQRVVGGLLLVNVALVALLVALMTDGVAHVDDYTDAMVEIIKRDPRGIIESREPLDENPVFGRILHAKGTHRGIPVEYYLGVFARGDRAFQVMAFTHQRHFPELADELRRAITTFELPEVGEEKE